MALEDLLIAGYIQRIEAIAGAQRWYVSAVNDNNRYSHVVCKSYAHQRQVAAKLTKAGLVEWTIGRPCNELFAYVRIGHGKHGLLQFQWFYTPEGW